MRRQLVGLPLVFAFCSASFAQERLSQMPNYERYRTMPGKLRSAVVYGRVEVHWSPDGKFAYFQQGEAWKQVDLGTGTVRDSQKPTLPERQTTSGGRQQNRGFPERGRQFTVDFSDDGQWKAFYRDRNLWLSKVDGSEEKAITTDGSEKTRIKYGTGTWVYGEELGQREAIWFSPDSKKVAFYRVDESKIPDYYLTSKIAAYQNTLYTEAYVKAGGNNPIVDLFIYDLASGKTVAVDARNGQPFTDDSIGHYVYAVSWSPDSKELWFNRTNRLQNQMEWASANPETGAVTPIIRENWPTGWTENKPGIRWINNGQQFLWTSERNGYANYYLYNKGGKLANAVTKQNAGEAGSIVDIDEKGKVLYYYARSGPNPHFVQFHRVTFDGTGDRRLTNPDFYHQVSLSPDRKFFVDTYDRPDAPASMQIVRVSDGKVITKLAEGSLEKFKQEGGKPVELFTYKAADGLTPLWGEIHYPSNFDASQKYPVLVSTYNGPESGTIGGRFEVPMAIAELGFICVQLETRGGANRGKAFKDQAYLKLGFTEIDDLAAGIKALSARPYVDGGRVGIFGTSYGGYSSVMALLRYPDLFHAASASSSVTDWRHYDSIYTERYMGLPTTNKAGYDAGSAMTYAKDKKGALLLYFGTLDDNVHPANTYDLINALNRAGKNYQLQVGPDQGHTGVRFDRMLEFFIEELILKK
jgi:dipeptidyl-peptidase-4